MHAVLEATQATSRAPLCKTESDSREQAEAEAGEGTTGAGAGEKGEEAHWGPGMPGARDPRAALWLRLGYGSQAGRRFRSPGGGAPVAAGTAGF